MKLSIFILSVIFSSALYAKEANLLVGTWQGFCEPLSNEMGGRICSYNFLTTDSGTYTCQFSSDLRCTKEIEKKTSVDIKYEFTTLGKVKFIYPGDKEIAYELNNYTLKGDLLTVRGIEVKYLKDKKPFKSKIGPFYYTRTTKN